MHTLSSLSFLIGRREETLREIQAILRLLDMERLIK